MSLVAAPKTNLRRIRLYVNGIGPALDFPLSEEDRRRKEITALIQDATQEPQHQDAWLEAVQSLFEARFGADVEHDAEYTEIMEWVKHFLAVEAGCCRGGPQTGLDAAVRDELVAFLKEVVPNSASLKQIYKEMKEEFF